MLESAVEQSNISFSDIIKSMWYITLCWGSCADGFIEHLGDFLKDELKDVPLYLIPKKSLCTGARCPLPEKPTVLFLLYEDRSPIV